MKELEVKGLRKVYGSDESAVVAIRELTFDVERGEFVCIVGPSGCGKTTLLKCLAGLLRPSEGSAFLEGKRIEGPPEGLALVFQDYSRSLLPWLTVWKNVTLPLIANNVGKTERTRRANEALEAVGLKDFTQVHPWQLSGGMQQRVAIARALAYQPSLLLMDEPFASVDAQTRGDLEDLVLRVHEEFGITVVFVTHDIDESVYLASRVVVLEDRPTSVSDIVEVPLPRPRDQAATRELPEFGQLRSRVFRMIKGGSTDRSAEVPDLEGGLAPN